MRNLSKQSKGGVCFSALIICILIFSLAASLSGEAFFPDKGAAYRCFSSLGSLIPLVIIAVIARTVWKDDFSGGFLLKLCRPRFFGLSLLFAFGMFTGLGFINLLLSDAIVSLGGKVQADFIVNGATELVLYLIFLCALPAITEELFFRGLLLSSLDGCKKITAVIAVALCFSLYHTSLTQFFYQAVYGAGLCLLTLKAESVLPAVAAHFINNAAVIVLRYFGVMPDLFSVWFILSGTVSLAAFFSVIFLTGRKNPKDGNADERKNKSVKGFYAFASAGLAVAALIAVLGVAL